jgi:hypothetical protein
MKRFTVILVLLLSASLVRAGTTVKQCDFLAVAPAKPNDPPPYPTLRCKVGTAMTGLRPGDFTFKSGVEIAGKAVEPFATSSEELDLVILVQGTVRFLGNPVPDETGTTIPGYYEQVKEAIDTFAKARPHDTKVALMVYADTVVTKVALGPWESVTGEALGPVGDYARSNSKALALGLHLAQTTLDQQQGRRVLVVIGDGGDQNEGNNLSAEVRKLAESGIEVFVLGGDWGGMESGNQRRLSRLGALGDFQQASQADQMPQFATALAAEMNNVYIVDFPGQQASDSATMPFDGEEHEFTIAAKHDESAPHSQHFRNFKAPEIKVDSSSPWPMIGMLGGLGALACVGVGVILVRRKPDEPVEVEDEPEQPAAVPAVAPVAPAPPVKQHTMVHHLQDDIPVVGWIVPLNGAQQFKTYRLAPGKNVIGSLDGCRVAIADPYMSGEHAEIVMNQTSFILVDRGSTNGTLVNAKRIHEQELLDNDVFVCGQTEFKFKSIN